MNSSNGMDKNNTVCMNSISQVGQDLLELITLIDPSKEHSEGLLQRVSGYIIDEVQTA
ncbi:hypothetical protein [Vibrio sp. SCSIO 43136]|uniref:hypothetical protein n=1 Tax=Vibrio sp. SCSIO 43136 TaxID=2819101 RepID=UPI002075C37C|nr:hypothetical protein [Vibrio sp. SCSIO 43136]USD64188.1 hypothetical protein J4N39_08700 [Vibrio sp. SCSIO 43136]